MPDHFPYVRKGYDAGLVDKRIEELETELREYREKDATISNAILSAQTAADEIIRKANIAADTIIQNARNLSAKLNETSAGQVMLIIGSVKEQRRQLGEFKEEYAALLNKYILQIDESDISQAEKKSIELEGYLQKFVDTELVKGSSDFS